MNPPSFEDYLNNFINYYILELVKLISSEIPTINHTSEDYKHFGIHLEYDYDGTSRMTYVYRNTKLLGTILEDHCLAMLLTNNKK